MIKIRNLRLQVNVQGNQEAEKSKRRDAGSKAKADSRADYQSLRRNSKTRIERENR